MYNLFQSVLTVQPDFKEHHFEILRFESLEITLRVRVESITISEQKEDKHLGKVGRGYVIVSDKGRASWSYRAARSAKSQFPCDL